MSAARGCKLLQEIKTLNDELQTNTDLTEEKRRIIRTRLSSLTNKYHALSVPQQEGITGDRLKALKDIPAVDLDEGKHKFVLVQVELDGEVSYFVRAKTYAKYHYMAAEPLVECLLRIGVPHEQIEIPGGGRCHTDYSSRKIFVYGYSNQYGQAPMGRVVQTIQNDPQFQGWDVTFSLDGY